MPFFGNSSAYSEGRRLPTLEIFHRFEVFLSMKNVQVTVTNKHLIKPRLIDHAKQYASPAVVKRIK